MLKFDHLRLAVSDLARSRNWYIQTLGMVVEFEVPDRSAVALQDTEGFTLFIQAALGDIAPGQCALWFQVSDVDATASSWSERGVKFNHLPRKSYWGYGAELADPDGHLIRLWDEKSMRGR